MSEAGNQRFAWLEDASERQFPLLRDFSLGRADTNDLPLPADEKVSRRHAVIQLQGNAEFWLVDFGSRNGTYLNEGRVIKPTRLYTGDRIRIGSNTFVFQQLGGMAQLAESSVPTDQTVAAIAQADCWLLVADVIDSTKLVHRIAPEELPKVTGRWLAECKQIIEAHAGRINQFMGDGFFAYWRHQDQMESLIAQAGIALRRLQEVTQLKFRFALHFGSVTFGGTSVGEEERISGPQVHFVFRMEKLAGQLGEARILSAPAAEKLENRLTTKELGRHTLPGFEGEFVFYTL